MKFRFISAAATLFIFSLSAHAIEPTHAKLLSHKEWTTGSATGTFKMINHPQASVNQSHLATLLKREHNVMNDISVRDTIFRNGVPAMSGKTATTYGHSEVFIGNDANEPHQYTIESYLCAYDALSGKDQPDCFKTKDVYLIPAHDIEVFALNPVMEYSVNENTIYERYIATLITKDNEENSFSSYDGTID